LRGCGVADMVEYLQFQTPVLEKKKKNAEIINTDNMIIR
jgi:hypothetical protein